MKRFGFFFFNIFVILLFFSFVYYYKENVTRLFQRSVNILQPCQNPITYSIVDVDPRFGLTKEKLLSDIEQSEKVWESPVDKQLFQYSPTGDLKISLIYDYRQKAADDLKKIGIVIHEDKASYDELKAKYNSLIVSYDKQKAELDALVTVFDADKNAYEKEVAHWNELGGAPQEDYDRLEQKKLDLSKQVEIINETTDSFNTLVDLLNSTELVLNNLVTKLNLQVSTYNAVSSSTGREFSEGEYVRSVTGTAINIYQFDDIKQLIRVMAHELGHAINIGHLDNPKAIMYYLNEDGINDKLTTDDLDALKKVCGIK